MTEASGVDTPVRFQRPAMPAAADIERFFEVARERRWFSNFGPCHAALTGSIEERFGPDAQVTLVSSGTAGLLVALHTLAVARSGDQVLMPSFTFPAAVNAAIWLGLKPVFVDIEDAGWHIAAEALARAIEARGDAIAVVVACSAFGTTPAPQQSAEWERLCEAAGIPLIVDSAAGFGAIDGAGAKQQPLGDAEVFSFHATKPFAIGEGGMVVCTDADLARQLHEAINFGFDRTRTITTAPGLNFKLSELHAATGLAALERLDATVARRRAGATTISEALRPEGFTFQSGHELATWQFVPTIVPESFSADAIASALEGLVETRRYYEPLHLMPYLAGAQAEPPVVTEAVAERMLCLPMWPDMGPDTVAFVADAVAASVDTGVTG